MNFNQAQLITRFIPLDGPTKKGKFGGCVEKMAHLGRGTTLLFFCCVWPSSYSPPQIEEGRTATSKFENTKLRYSYFICKGYNHEDAVRSEIYQRVKSRYVIPYKATSKIYHVKGES